MEKQPVIVRVTPFSRATEAHSVTDVCERDSSIILSLQKNFYDDLVQNVTMGRRLPEGFTVGRPIVTPEKFHGQIIHCFVRLVRQMEKGIFPTEVKLRRVEKEKTQLRMIFHKDGTATLVLPQKACRELDRTLYNMGGLWFEAMSLQQMVIQFNTGKEKFHAYYLSGAGEYDGYKGNGSPRLVSLLTVLAYMERMGQRELVREAYLDSIRRSTEDAGSEEMLTEDRPDQMPDEKKPSWIQKIIAAVKAKFRN